MEAQQGQGYVCMVVWVVSDSLYICGQGSRRVLASGQQAGMVLACCAWSRQVSRHGGHFKVEVDDKKANLRREMLPLIHTGEIVCRASQPPPGTR